MSTVASPVVGLPVPLASVLTTLMLQLEALAMDGFGVASGGPKKRFAVGGQLAAMEAQSASDVQLLCGLGPAQAQEPVLTPVQQGAGIIVPVHPLEQLVALKHVAPMFGPVVQVPAFTH